MDQLNQMFDKLREITELPAMPPIEAMADNQICLEHTEKFVREVLIGNKDANIESIFSVLLPNNHLLPIIVPFVDEDSKDKAARIVRLIAERTKAVRYTFMSEAWVRCVSQEQWNEFQKSNKKISDCEDRKEVVIIMAGDKDGTLHRSLEIVRDWETGIVTDLIDMGLSDSAIGKFTGLLQDL